MATKRLKVATIVGTRPEIIKLSRVIAEFDARTDHVLIHTGQNHDYTLNEIFFQELEIRKPDRFLETAGDGYAQTLARVIERSDAALRETKPDAVLILGDTNSCLSAIAAKRNRIPVFHMEAGNRCFDDRVPEEINRRIVDHISDINMPYTEHARRYLLAEGIRPEIVIKTGSPMMEVLTFYRKKIDASGVLGRLGLPPGGYFVFSAHREENVDAPETLARLIDSLNAVVTEFGKPAVFSTHPRTRKRLDALGGASRPDPRIRFIEPLGFPDYVKLQESAFCVVSDSGTLTEESAILDFPAVTIREAHERPEGMDEGTLVMSGLDRDRLLQAISMVTSQHKDGHRAFQVPPDYTAGNVSKKVVRIILGYRDYVMRTIWRT